MSEVAVEVLFIVRAWTLVNVAILGADQVSNETNET